MRRRRSAEYLDVLGVLHSLMRELRSKPRNEVEAHFEDPAQIAGIPEIPDPSVERGAD